MFKVQHLTKSKNPDLFEWSHEIKPEVNELYAIGNTALFKAPKRVGIVGSRIISKYGLQVLNLIIPALVKANVTIVSGGAFGVDYNSQNIALDFGGKVITVLGSGIENPTPKTNANFFYRVQEKGLLLSEDPGKTPAFKHSFVKRNRIIAGLSDIILIIEAREKSGALITADFANQMGKTVCCFPGRAFDYLAKGSNDLIKQGALLVDTADEILEVLQYSTQFSQRSLTTDNL